MSYSGCICRLLPVAIITVCALFATCNVQAMGFGQDNGITRMQLEQDKRLDRIQSITEVCLPLAEALRRCSSTDCKLRAAPNCRELKLQLRLHDRTVRATMLALADLLPGQWLEYPDRSGYQLAMMREYVKKRETWWGLYLGEWERARNTQRNAVLAEMRNEHVTKVADASSPDAGDSALARQVDEHAAFYHDLPAGIQEQIADRQCDLFFLGCPVHSGLLEGTTVVPLSELTNNQQK